MKIYFHNPLGQSSVKLEDSGGECETKVLVR